ncbi:MAG: pyridoxamine 5'-phosphate oxidase family protein [Anaerolineales bacterium]
MASKLKNPDEIHAFLDRAFPTMLGVISTLDVDGHPHGVPVWYRYDGASGRVHIWTLDTRRWVKNIARDPRVSFAVQEDKPPFAAVILRGRAAILTGDGSEISDEIRRITRRYVEEPEIENYIQGWLHLRTIVTLTPEKITAWGVGY